MAEFATVACSIHVLWAWGFREFLMVGFDSMEKDWDGKKDPAYPPEMVEAGVPQRAHADYQRINRQITDLLQARGVKVEWWHSRIRAPG